MKHKLLLALPKQASVQYKGFPEGLRRYRVWLYSTESRDSLPLPLVTLWKRLIGESGRATPEGVEDGASFIIK